MKFKRFLAFGIPLLIALLIFYPYKQVIAFSFEDQGELIAYFPLKKEKEFKIEYTHSIHLTDVLESYRLSEKQIEQIELAYHDFAVGMPSNAEGEEVFEEKDGTYFIKNMKRNFTHIDLRVGQVKANHRLIYDEKTYTLADFIEPGTWVRISSERISLWEQLKGVKISG
ncbi:DUF1850 domain-containing protein [Peribacillus simplex]|uniref:DUF1850 domain-containing protein n=1 Tax=Peribacillus simplex TaxID=1478 RepID=A0A9X8ZEN4_9BACI|nr:DUF1850 domain-containing protein [Peribacillus simplex]TKH09001.1 DUF1850 domain-containing protein [Peribacillus simplex]